MRKVFFAIVFVLVGSLSFASNTVEPNIITKVNSEIKIIGIANVVDKNLIEKTIMFKECHVTIKGTVNGKEIDVDVTFTSDSGSCIKDTVKLLKELAEE